MAFVMTDGRREFAPAGEYYRLFPREITKSGAALPVGLPVVSFEPRTLQGLAYSLNTYAFQRDDKDVVLVAHGHTDPNRGPLGLGMPLNELTEMPAIEEAFGDLERMLNNCAQYEKIAADAEKKFRSPAETGAHQSVRMAKGTLEQVFNCLVLVRYRELNRLEIRACNLGLNEPALASLGRLLGVKYISAPNAHMFYVRVRTGQRVQTAAAFEQWVRSHPRARVFLDDADSKKRFALRVLGTGPWRQTESATTATSLGWFLDRFVMKGSSFSGSREFVVAGIDHMGAKPFVLPLEPEYRDHLVQVGPLPSLEPWMRGHDSQSASQPGAPL